MCETHQSVDPQSATAESQQAYCQQQCLCCCDTFDANMFSDRKRKELRKVEEEEHLNCSSGLHFDGTSSFTGTVKRPGDRNTGYVVWTQQHRDFTDLKFLLQQPMKGRASKSRRHQERRVVRISE